MEGTSIDSGITFPQSYSVNPGAGYSLTYYNVSIGPVLLKRGNKLDRRCTIAKVAGGP